MKRNVKQIKKRWENLKAKAKVAIATDMKERRKTGGGTKPTPIDEVTDRVVSVIGDTLNHLPNSYDCDTGYHGIGGMYGILS